MAPHFPYERLAALAFRPDPDRLLAEGLDSLLKAARSRSGAIFISSSSPRRFSRGRLPQSARQALESGRPHLPKSATEKKQILHIPLQSGHRSIGWVTIISKKGSSFKVAERGPIVRQARALGELAWLAGEVEYLRKRSTELSHHLAEDQSRLLRAEEEVRHELARDLHDSTVQRLGAIAMGLEYVQQLVQARPEAVAHELESLRTLAIKASQEARLLLFELRPLVLESQGLTAALSAYVEQMPATQANMHLELGNFNRRLAGEKEGAIFDIIREAVRNARRHAKAENISIRLVVEGKWLVFAVEDDGRGFDPKQVEKAYDRRVHFGLLNMRERAETIGGEVTVESTPGRGTIVILRVPVS